MSRLVAGQGFRDFRHAERERLVVRECSEGPAHDEEQEVSYSEVHCQELAVEGAVLGLQLAQLLEEET